MELNREQIIKALECCSENEDCANCPRWENCKSINSLLRDTLALIRELTEENERLSRTRYMVTPDGRTEMIPSVESVKVDTVRKMQEKFNQVFGGVDATNALLRRTFEQIAKELLEEV